MRTRFALSTLVAGLALAGSASAAVPQTVFTFTQAQNGEPSATFFDTVAVSGGNAYAFFRDTTATSAGVVTKFDGVNFTTVMTQAQWAGSGATTDMGSGSGAGIVGNKARFINFFTSSVYEVDLGTGTPTQVVSKLTIDAAVGTSAQLTAQFETASDGTIYGFDGGSDSIIAITPGGSVSIEVPNASLGVTSIGGIGVDGTNLIIGNNNTDSLQVWDTNTNLLTTVLTTAQIKSVTDEPAVLTAGFGDIFKAPDGLVYFYETVSDYLLSYNPANPAGTLSVVVSEAEFLSGPSSDIIAQLGWWNGKIAFVDQGNGTVNDGFFVVPEPTSLALLTLGGLMIARRRR